MSRRDEAILLAVASLPEGRTTSYKAIGQVVGCGPRQVGIVLAAAGERVPWWRVVRSDRRIPPHLLQRAEALLEKEGVIVHMGRVGVATHIHHS